MTFRLSQTGENAPRATLGPGHQQARLLQQVELLHRCGVGDEEAEAGLGAGIDAAELEAHPVVGLVDLPVGREAVGVQPRAEAAQLVEGQAVAIGARAAQLLLQLQVEAAPDPP